VPSAMKITDLKWTPELIKKFWDYQSVHGTQQYFGKMVSGSLIRKIKKYLHRDSTILDYGCGPGYLMEALLRNGNRVFGYDSSPHSISVARQRLESFPRLLGLSSEALQADEYDVIFALELIEHLSDEVLEDTLNLFKRLLSSKGRLILSTPDHENLADHTV